MEDIVKVIRIDTGDAENSLNTVADLIRKVREELSGVSEYKSAIEELSAAWDRLSKSISDSIAPVSEAVEAFKNLKTAVEGISGVLGSVPEGEVTINSSGIDSAISDISRLSDAVAELGKSIESLPPVDVEVSENGIHEVQEEIDQLSGTSVDVEVEVSDSSLDNLQGEIDSISGATVEVGVEVSESGIDELQHDIDQLSGTTVEVGVEVSDTGIQELKKEIGQLSGTSVEVTVEVSDDSLDSLQSEIDSVSGSTVEVGVEVSDDSIDGLQEEIDSISGTSVDVEVHVSDDSLDNLQSEIDSISGTDVEVNVEVQGENDIDHVISLIGELGQEIDNLSPEGIGRLRDEINGLLGDSTKSFRGLKQELAELTREWEEAGTDIERADIASRIKAVTEEMQRMRSEGGLETVKSLKEYIGQLKDALVNLNPETEKYKDTMEQLISAEMRLTTAMRAGKNEITAAQGSYNSLVNEMSALKKVWREVTDETERSKIAQRINEINSELKRMDATLGNHQRNVGNYTSALQNVTGNTASWRRELKDLKIAMQSLDPATREYEEAFKRAAQLTHDLAEQQQQLKYGSPDLGDKLSNLAGIATDIAGGMSAMNAAMGLMGNGNEDMQKAMLTATRLIQLVQGLSKLDDLRKRLEGLGKSFSDTKGQAAEYETQIQGLGGAGNVAAAGANTLAGAVNAAAGATIKASTEFADAVKKVNEMTTASKGLENDLHTLSNDFNSLANQLAVLNIEFQKGTISEEEFNAKAAPIKARMSELDGALADVMFEMSEVRKSTIETTAAFIGINPSIVDASRHYTALSEKIEEYKASINSLNPEIADEKAQIDDLKMALEVMERHVREIIDENGEEVKTIAPLIDTLDLLNDKYKEGAVDAQQYAASLSELKSLKEGFDSGTLSVEQFTSACQMSRSALESLTPAVNNETAAINRNMSATTKTISTLWGFISQKKLERAERKKATAEAKANTAAVNGETAATIRYTGAAKLANIVTIGLSKAFTVLKSAIIATGIGAVFILISKFVSDIGPAFSDMLHRLNKDWQDSAEKVRLYQKALEALQHQIEGDNRMMNFETQLMQVQGKTELEVLKRKREYIKAMMDQTRAMAEQQQAEWDGLTIKQQESKKYKEVREEMEKTMEVLKDLEDQYQDVGEAIILAEHSVAQGLAKTDQDAANSLKSAIQLENEAYKQQKAEFDKAGKDTENLTRAHNKKIRDLIDAQTKSIVDRAKAANQDELQNLEDKYNKELQLLMRFGISTENLTREYVAARQKILDKAAIDELKRQNELMHGLITEYDIMQAAGAKASQEYKERLDMDYQLDMEYYGKMKAIYQAVIDDETTTANARKEAEKNLADTLKIENERTTRYLLDNIRRRTSELDDEIDTLERYKEAQIEALEQSQRMLKSMPKGEDTEFKSFFKTTFEFDQGSYDDQEAAIRNRYNVIEEYLRKEEQAYQRALISEETTQEEKTETQRKLTDLRKKMMDEEANKVIELAELAKDKNRQIADTILDVAGSISDVFGGLADAISAHTEAMLKEGKITDKEAQKEFKRVKNLQLAQAYISMISGAIGAYMQASQTIPPPYGQIVGAAAAAGVMATGAAQIEQIRHTEPGSNSTSSSFNNVAVTPTYEAYRPDTVRTVTGEGEELKLRNAMKGMNLWVSVTDIDNAQKGRQVRVSESKF